MNIKRVISAFIEFVDDRLYGLEEDYYPNQLLDEWVCNDSNLKVQDVDRISELRYRGYNLNLEKGILGFYTLEIKRSVDE